MQKHDGNREIIEMLELALLKERESLTSQLEHRHQAIIVDISKKLSTIPSASNTTAPFSTSGTSIVAAPRPSKVELDEYVYDDEPVEPTIPDGSERGTGSKQLRSQRTGTSIFSTQSRREVEKPTLYQRYADGVNGNYFEATFGVVIVFSAIVMGLEMQYRGLVTGERVGYPAYTKPAPVLWPWAEDFFFYVEWVLGILFSLELILKLVAQHRLFFCEIWNWIDMLIVTSWLTTTISEHDGNFNPNILRLLRLMRLLRLLRLLGMISAFDSLYLMTTAIRESLSILVWAVLVLTLVEMSIACLLQAAVQDYLRSGKPSQEAAFEVFMHFGTFARSMLSMFELTLGNWIVPTRALVEHVSEWYIIFFLVHKFVIGFSVVSVITGVFIQETFKVATSDDQILLNSKTRSMRDHTTKMTKLFKHADHNGDGNLDRQEFEKVMADPIVRKWLSSIGLDIEDVDKLFELFHGGDSKITAHELVDGAGRLKGFARSIDLMTFITEYRQDRFRMMELLEQRDLRWAASVSGVGPSTWTV